jgi:hypothetical protein
MFSTPIFSSHRKIKYTFCIVYAEYVFSSLHPSPYSVEGPPGDGGEEERAREEISV